MRAVSPSLANEAGEGEATLRFGGDGYQDGERRLRLTARMPAPMVTLTVAALPQEPDDEPEAGQTQEAEGLIPTGAPSLGEAPQQEAPGEDEGGPAGDD